MRPGERTLHRFLTDLTHVRLALDLLRRRAADARQRRIAALGAASAARLTRLAREGAARRRGARPFAIGAGPSGRGRPRLLDVPRAGPALPTARAGTGGGRPGRAALRNPAWAALLAECGDQLVRAEVLLARIRTAAAEGAGPDR